MVLPGRQNVAGAILPGWMAGRERGVLLSRRVMTHPLLLSCSSGSLSALLLPISYLLVVVVVVTTAANITTDVVCTWVWKAAIIFSTCVLSGLSTTVSMAG